jgi:hypothetical protein
MSSYPGVPEKVIKYIQGVDCVTIEDVMDKFGISRISSKNYLSRLSREGMISRTNTGTYVVVPKEKPQIEISSELQRIAESIEERLFDVEFVLWGTEFLAPYSHYALGKEITFIDSRKISLSKIRDILLSKNYQVIIEPSKEDFQKLFLYFEKPILLFAREEMYATQQMNSLRIPTFERIFVDLYFLITRRDFPFPPDELGRILYNFLEVNELKYTTMFRYASRRGIRDEIVILLFSFYREYEDLGIPEEIFIEGKKRCKLFDEIVKGALP